MPRRQRDSLVQSTLSFKKLKPHQDDVEDVPVETKYAVSYLWKKTHFYLVKETFAYLDLRTSTKFSRVAPAWRDIMLDSVAINKGIAFLDWRVGADFRGETQMERALVLAKSWMTLFGANFEGLTHFVWMGEAATLKDPGQRDKLLALPQTLSNITFWGSSFTDERVLETATFFLKKGKTVVLKKCEIGTHEKEFLFGSRYRSPAWGNQFGPMGVNWNLKVVVPSLVFDEAFLKIERIPFTDARQDWLYKRYDERGLIWPYGEDQKEWLKASLSILKGKPLEAFKYADNMYLHWRPCYNMTEKKSGLMSMGMETEATSDGRVLDTLDCAWFGRLLVCMDAAKHIPKFKLPPHAFPKDFDV